MNNYFNSAKEGIESQRRKNDDWYNRRYNEDATQRADAQALLTRTEESIRNRNRQAAGTQAVMGGTEESVAAAKAANNQALADVTTNIAANAEARKDAIENQHRSRDAQLENQMTQLEREKAYGKAQNIAAAVQGVGQFAGGLAQDLL